MDYHFENVGGGIKIAVSDNHTFMTDSFLLSYFAIPQNKDSVCDFGAGAGAIPLLWYREPHTTPREVWALDIQEQAVEQMKISVKESGIESFHPIVADVKDIKKHLPAGSVSLITCNPPYKTEGSGIISTSGSDKIARHETMLTIDDVCSSAKWLLQFGGRLCICQLSERLVDVLGAMRRHSIEPKRLRLVQNTADGAPWMFMVEGKRGSKPFLQIEPPLIMRENGRPTQEMDKIYGMYGKVV